MVPMTIKMWMCAVARTAVFICFHVHLNILMMFRTPRTGAYAMSMTNFLSARAISPPLLLRALVRLDDIEVPMFLMRSDSDGASEVTTSETAVNAACAVAAFRSARFAFFR